MATSGITTFNQTTNEIISSALRKLGVLGDGQVASGNQYTDSLDALNRLVKSLQAKGIFLWTREWINQALTASEEVTGTDAEVYTCVRSHTSSNDNKPITGDEWQQYWVKRGSTGGVWAISTAYNSIIAFTLDSEYINVDKAIFRRDDYEYELDLIAIDEYIAIGDKQTQASVPDTMALDLNYPNNTCYIYPEPADASPTSMVSMLAVKKLEDFVATSDNPDFPSRWISTLVWGLSAELSSEYGKPLDERYYYDNKFNALIEDTKKEEHQPVTSGFIRSAY